MFGPLLSTIRDIAAGLSSREPKPGSETMTVGRTSVPFLDLKSFSGEESETQELESATTPPNRLPFVSVYELADGEKVFDDPFREAYTTLVNELYDEEFDEALFELLTDARIIHQDNLASGASSSDADRLATQRFSQLTRESESIVDAFTREFTASDGTRIVESEIDSFIEQYSTSAQIDPAFENFFGKLIKKVGKAVKKVAKGIAKIGIGPILNQIKALIKPLLNKVLQKAIGRLPEAVWPAAHQLAAKLGFAKSAEQRIALGGDTSGASGDSSVSPEIMGSAVQASAGVDIAAIQKEFDEQIASAMLAEDEVELNLEVARLRSSSSAVATPVFANLDDARDRFIQELDNLKPGESAEPFIQNFLPAVLPALRLGVGMIGRPRVVQFLAKLLAKLISRLVGPRACSSALESHSRCGTETAKPRNVGSGEIWPCCFCGGGNG